MFGGGGSFAAVAALGVANTIGLPAVQSFPPPFPPFSYPTLEGVWYIDSAGSNQYPYNEWAKAANALATIDAIDVAGDVIYCASTGSETTAASISFAWSGTPTSPTRIISADKTSGAPPTVIAAGYTVNVTGAANTLNVASTGVAYLYGITFVVGTTSGTSGINNSGLLADTCSFQLSGASGSVRFAPGGGTTLLNCTCKFGAVGQTIVGSGRCFSWSGGGFLSGGVTPTAFLLNAAGASLQFENLDLSNAASTLNLSASSSAGDRIVFRNTKLPSSWTGSLNSVTPGAGGMIVINNCDSAGTNYILHRQTQFGDVYSETTIVRTGGASDGTTPLSWKMVSLVASGTFPITALQTGEWSIWNDTTGSSKTVTVEGIWDSITNIQNNQIWLEVDYYGASGNPQGTLASSAMANVLSTPSDVTASSATWTTTGMTNPNKFKLVVTFTPLLKGTFLATVKLCKPSTTVYIDPMMTVT